MIKAFLVGLIPLAFALQANATAIDDLNTCRSIQDDIDRLNCYDSVDFSRLVKAKAPDFQGKRSFKTPLLNISAQTTLRYQSDGVIFVLAIHDKDGNVVQNLHIGGGGEDTFVIEQAGTFFLRINGSSTWKVWLEPSE